jgi:large subunit ribosomal protein L15e
MSMYKELRTLWKDPKENLGQVYKDKIIQWNNEPVTVKLERPTRLDRARSLGYKAKQGIFVVRQKLDRGSHFRPKMAGGRRSKTQRRLLVLRKSYQNIAEERVSKNYPNCEVLNSYWVGDDGQTVWYEVIMVDTNHPVIKSDKNLSNLQTGRAYRGLTSAGRKSRGLAGKGEGFEKARPSRRAHKRNH